MPVVTEALDRARPVSSRRRDCHSADALSPSPLIHLLKVQEGAAQGQNSRQRRPVPMRAGALGVGVRAVGRVAASRPPARALGGVKEQGVSLQLQ